MGFDVVYVADIQQFPRPLYPKYKHNFRPGCRLDIPAVIGDLFIEVDYLFPAVTMYELIYVVVALSGYKDGDSWSLHWNDKIIFSDIHFKEYSERKHLQPVRRFDPKTDVLRFVFHNKTGTSKVLWADFECACRIPITIEHGVRIPTITPFLALLIIPPSGKYTEWFNCTIQYNSPCNIWYTDDESDPTTDGTCIPYNGPFLINGPCVIKAIGIDIWGNISSIVRADYDVEIPVEPLTVIANPSGGEYPNTMYVVLFANLPSVIYYTLDETEPDLDSDTYLTPILLKTTTTIKFFAVSDDGNQVTDVMTEVYVIEEDVVPPVDPPVDPPVGTKDYLKMFVVTDTNDPNYVDPNSISTTYASFNDYWTKFAQTVSSVFSYPNFPKPFYDGRNTIRVTFWSQNSASISSVTNYYKYMWKLFMDLKSGLVISEIAATNFNAAKTYMQGIGITNSVQQMSIYMTYHTGALNLAFQSFVNVYGAPSNALDAFPKYMNKKLGFVFDWIDWCDIEPNSSIGGFESQFGVDNTPGYKSCLNIEPNIKDFSALGNGCEIPLQFKKSGSSIKYMIQEGIEDPYMTEYIWPGIITNMTTMTTDPVKEAEAMLAHVSIHEMGHAIDHYAKYRGDVYRLAWTQEWFDIWKWTSVASAANLRNPPGWDPSTQDYPYPKYPTDYHQNLNMNNGEPPITVYGCSQPIEDFAESYACYQTNKKYLQDKFPKRYAFMQKHVDPMVEVSV